MREVTEASLARRWRRSARRDADPACLTRGLAALAAVGPISARPGSIEATVRAARGDAYTAAIGLDVLGPTFRERWLRAATAGATGQGDGPGGDGQLPDAMPAPGALHPRCTCPDAAPSGWCKHACALAEAVALALETHGPDLLWRARGLSTDGAGALVLAPPAPTQAADGRDAADAAAFWGDDADDSEGQDWQAWTEAPAAFGRLGPLPTARGQTAAADPIVAHYRRVRDSVRTWFEGAEAPAKRAGSGRERVGDGGDRARGGGAREETARQGRTASRMVPGRPGEVASSRKDNSEESGGP